MHVVPNVDDGAADMAMALDMLQMAYEQGVRDIFCTSHNAYDSNEIKRYYSQLTMLRMIAKSKFPDLELHAGCELLCSANYIDDILHGLEGGIYLPLGNSKYVLTELHTDTTSAEAKQIARALIESGWKPILAHVERYPNLFNEQTIQNLLYLGTKIQVNLYSLSEERNTGVKERARYLVLNQYAHFVGSDAHRSNHRPPSIKSGVNYIYENCDKYIADAICCNNAEHLLLGADQYNATLK